jgi:hypothetical protein
VFKYRTLTRRRKSGIDQSGCADIVPPGTYPVEIALDQDIKLFAFSGCYIQVMEIAALFINNFSVFGGQIFCIKIFMKGELFLLFGFWIETSHIVNIILF